MQSVYVQLCKEQWEIQTCRSQFLNPTHPAHLMFSISFCLHVLSFTNFYWNACPVSLPVAEAPLTFFGFCTLNHKNFHLHNNLKEKKKEEKNKKLSAHLHIPIIFITNMNLKNAGSIRVSACNSRQKRKQVIPIFKTNNEYPSTLLNQ